MKNRERKMVDLRPKWTPEEEKALREGVAKHGVGKWKIIVNDPQFSHTLCSRSNRNLRDKWRYMNDASRKSKPTIEDQKMSEVETEVEVDSEVEIDSEVKVEVEAEAEDNESEQLEAAERVAFLIADAENKEKRLAESYKNLQKLIEMKEETYAILKIAQEIFDKTLHDYS